VSEPAAASEPATETPAAPAETKAEDKVCMKCRMMDTDTEFVFTEGR
jgi:hypothetical protein